MTNETPGRLRKIKEVKAIYKQALSYLRYQGFAKNSREYRLILKALDQPSYLAALANALQSFNIPEIGVSPNASASEFPQYKGKLPLFGALLVSSLAPDFIKKLEENGERKIHIEYATELMSEYSKIILAQMTYGLDKANDRTYSQKQSFAGKKGGKKPSTRSIKINSIVDKMLSDAPKISAKEILRQVEGEGIELTKSEIYCFSSRVSKRRKKLIHLNVS